MLWDPIAGKQLWSKPFPQWREPKVVVAPAGRRLAVAPDGSRLAIWDYRANGLQLWNPTDGSDAGLLETDKWFVSAIDFTPDSKRLVVATLDGLSMWDVDARKRLPWGEGIPGAMTFVLSPNGQWLATLERDGKVRLRELATGREVRTFVGTALRVSVLCFSADSSRLVTGGADRTVRVWDVESGRELLSLPGVTEGVTSLAWDAKNDRLYALDFAVRVWGTK